MTSANPSKRCRVLVVEDEALIAIMIADQLTQLGYEIVGPVSKLDAAMTFAREARFDAAILDVTIRGGKTFPVAELLSAKSIPFAISSGYGDWALPDSLKVQPRLTKPFSESELEAMITSLCDGAKVESAA